MSANRQSLIKQPSTLIPTKRNSLGNLTNHELTPEEVERSNKKDSNLPKSSSIPRLHTTPTKTTSYLTPYGYKSPSSPSRSKSATPEPTSSRRHCESFSFTQAKATTKESNNKLNSSFTYSRSELDILKQQVEAREKDFAELKNTILSLKSSKQKIEFDNQVLEEKLSSLNKDLKIKSNQMENLASKKEDAKLDIQRDYDLKLKQMKVENEACMYEIENNYKNEIERVLSVKVSKIQQQKSHLQEKIANLNNDVQNNEVDFQHDLLTLRKQYDEKQKELKGFMEETRKSLEDDCKELDSNQLELVETLKNSTEELQNKLHSNELRTKELEETKESISESAAHLNELQEKLNLVQRSISEKNRMIQGAKSDIEWKKSHKIMFDEELIKEEVVRRRLHNKMQELKGNIRVFCRIRPPLKSEAEDIIEIKVPDNDEEEQEIVLKDSKPLSAGSFPNIQSSNTKKSFEFSFDRVFQMDSTNPEIFEEISQLVQSALDGFNVCIFAYGQTGSGKTHSMSSDDGMIPKAVKQIFETSYNLKERGWNFKIYGEFLEIYNENINDLLGNPNNIDKVKFEIRHDTINQKTSVTNLTNIELTDPQMVNEVLQKALKNRSIAATKANERSSRSHSVFTIRIKGDNHKTNEKSEGTLNLIDLAGSERLSHSQAVGDRLKETQSINKSLSCLGDVIYALGDSSKDNKRHIPFRNSKLTYLLQYSLGGNSKTLMFVNISPFNKHFDETINSLRFATKVNSTKLGTAKKNLS